MRSPKPYLLFINTQQFIMGPKSNPSQAGKFLLCLLPVILVFGQLKAADYESNYSSGSQNYNIYVVPGTYSFKVTNVPNNYWVEYYVNDVFIQTQQSGLLSSPTFLYYFSSNSNCKINIYDNNWNYLFTHWWNVYISLPDLIPSSTSISISSLSAGESLTASVTVQNLGQVSAVSSTLKYYLSTNTTYGTSDILLGSDAVASLTASGSGSESQILTIPVGTSPGTYYILFYTDADAVVSESNESNNVAYNSITIINTAKPDLRFISYSVNPTTAEAGGSITASCTIKNEGVADATASRMEYWFSTNTTYSTADTYLGYDLVASLTVGSSGTESGSLTIPSVSPGTYYLLFVADVLGEVSESDENDNLSYVTITVLAGNSPPGVPSTPLPLNGETGVIVSRDLDWATVIDPDGNNVDYLVYLGVDATPDEGEFLDTVTGSSYALSALEFDTHYYWKIVAIDNKGGSTDGPVWNFYTEPAKPDLNITTFNVLTTSINPGDSLSLNTIISNDGLKDIGILTSFRIGYYLSTDNSWDVGDEFIGYESFLGLAQGASKSENTMLVVSGDQMPLSSGSFYVLAVADYDSRIDEVSEVNNLVYNLVSINDPPSIPASPNPLNAALEVSIEKDLDWASSSDPNGDIVEYLVFFGTDQTPDTTEYKSKTTVSTYLLPTLLNSTTYYWRIDALDKNGGRSVGPVWNFTTESVGNNSPTIIKKQPAEPDTLAPEENRTFIATCTDLNGGSDFDKVEWYVNTGLVVTHNAASWTNPQDDSFNYTFTTSGSFSITAKVYDNSGLFDQTTWNIIVVELGGPPPLITDVQIIQDIACNGKSDGIAELTITDYKAPLSIQWDDPFSTISKQVSSLSAGIWYHVSVSDADNRKGIDSIRLTEPPKLLLQMTNVVNVTAQESNDGSAEVLVTGGTQPYEYLWDDPGKSTFSSVSGLSGNTWYHIIVTDANSCLVIDSIKLTEPVELYVEITDSSDATCHSSNDGSATVSISGGSPPYTIFWNDDGFSGTETVNNLPGNRLYSVTVRDADMVTKTDRVFIAEPEEIEISKSFTHKLCSGESNGQIELTGNGGKNPFSFQWSNDQNTSKIENLRTGKYSVIIRDANNCVKYDTTEIGLISTYQDQQICVVTVDIFTGYNLIVWEKNNGKGIESFNIYREGTHIGNVSFNDLSVFKDTGVNPEKRPYVYTIRCVDSCGNESGDSPYHRPLFLSYDENDNGVSLRWESYKVENFEYTFKNYQIYRSTDGISFTEFDDPIHIAVYVYNDLDQYAKTNKTYYRVAGILETPCFPSSAEKAGTGPYYHSLSNMDENKLKTGVEGLHYDSELGKLIIYPNPFTDFATVSFSNKEKDEYRLVIYDITGKIFLTRNNIREDEFQIQRNQLKPGFYLLELSGQTLLHGTFIVK